MVKKSYKFLLLLFFIPLLAIGYGLPSSYAKAVALQTEAVTIEQPGAIALGNVSIIALEAEAISSGDVLDLKIPADFPAVWDQEITTLSLTNDSSRGLINEAVSYPDSKTLRIAVTQSWPKNAQVTITNIKLNLSEFPAYEELFSGKLTNMAYLLLSFQAATVSSPKPVLLKLSPLYSGDDGWDAVESDLYPKTLAKFSITDITPSCPTVNRGFTAVVRALDGNDNFRAAAGDSVQPTSYLSTDPSTAGGAAFYSDSNYSQTASTYTLSSGKATIYVKDATIENIVLKATHTTDGVILGESEAVEIGPYKYQITKNNLYPMVNMQWTEQVQAEDTTGQSITTATANQVTLSSDGNIKFYADSNYSGSGADSLAYDLSGGTCTVYMKAPVSETVHIQADDTYGSRSNDGGGTSVAFTVIPADVGMHFDFSYDEEGGTGGTTDKLTIRAWIERNGLIVKGGLGGATLNIYDFSTEKFSLTETTAPTDGIYWFTKEDTGLDAGQGYFALATISYQGLDYKSGDNFYVTMDKQVLSQVGDISSKVDTLQTTTENLSDEIVTTVTPTLEDIEDDTGRAVTATEETIPDKIDQTQEEIQPHIVSRILNTETSVKQGEALKIRYRTYPDVSPVLDVYNPQNSAVLTDQAMSAVAQTDKGDIYEYALEFKTSWSKGFFTVVASEGTHGTLDGITINVIGTSLEQVGRDVTAVLGSTAGIEEVGTTKDIIEERFAEITGKLSELNKRLVQAVATTVEEVAGQLGKEQTRGIRLMMSEISEGLKSQGVDVKGDIKKMYESSEKSAENIDYLRNKFIQMENLLAVNQKMIDSVTYEPVIQSWFEFR